MPQTKQDAAQVSEQPSMSAAVKLDLAQFEGHRKPQQYAQLVKAGRGWLIIRNSATLADTDYERVGNEIVAALNADPNAALLALAKQQREEIEALRKALRNLVAAHDQYIRETGMKGNDLITERTEEARAALKGAA